ncbi:MAG: terminase small subunit [Pelagimonas sp.]|uniref:terminase small subunit n=1 Tax=Pelagimonas sp. TaxID=2073170 RepID=UPI003D6BB5E5
MAATKKLTEKQECFVEQYLIDLNATQAAIRAGYSERTAEQQGSRLLGNVKVAKEIAKAKAARSERTEITQDRVLEELARIAFSDLRRVLSNRGALIDVHDWDDDTAGAISSVEVVTKLGGEVDEDGNPIVDHVHKLKVWDKNAALEKLGKHLGMFKDRVQLSGDPDQPIKTEVVGGREKIEQFLDGIAERSAATGQTES